MYRSTSAADPSVPAFDPPTASGSASLIWLSGSTSTTGGRAIAATVYAPPGDDTVARQLAVRLRPLLLAEEKGYFDVEIRGNALYVYTTMFMCETAEVGRLLAFATKLRAVCGGVALGSSSAAVEGEAATTLPVVSKINWSFIVVVLFLGVAFMPAFPGSEALDGVRAAALYALFIAIAVWAVRQIKAGRKVKRQLSK